MADNQKVIGGRTYSFGMIPPTKSVPVQVAIARVLGEPFFKMATAAKSDAAENQISVMATAIGMLTAKMDPDELLRVMTTVFDYTSVDGSKIASIDSAFVGRNTEMWEAFGEGLRFNYADFLDALKSRTGKALGQTLS
jgi:hypothetical protein